MYKRLSKEEKIGLIKRVLRRRGKIAAVCKEAGVSRTVFYKWLEAYREKLDLPDKEKVFNQRRYDAKKRRGVMKFCLKHPEYSVKKSASRLGVSTGFVWNILKARELNTIKERLKHTLVNGVRLSPHLTMRERLTILQRYENKETVVKICGDYRISRTTFYKWVKQIKASSQNELEKDFASLASRGVTIHRSGFGKSTKNDIETNQLYRLDSKRLIAQRHWRYNTDISAMMLQVVTDHPEYSFRKVNEILKEKGMTGLSDSGVYNKLRRWRLQRHEQRDEYAKSQKVDSKRLELLLNADKHENARQSLISQVSTPMQELLQDVRLFILITMSSFIGFLTLFFRVSMAY